MLGVLRGLADDAPLLLAIDDEQWLDRPSGRVLAFALCRLRSEPVGVLLSRRLAGDSALWPELAHGFGGSGFVTLALEPLAIAALRRLVAARVGRPIARAQMRRIHEVSAGNPLYALAIADELKRAPDGDVASLELRLPDSLTEAIVRRLDQLDGRAADPLLVTAAVSRPSLAVLQSVLPDFVLGDLDSAERAGVIDVAGERVRFTHPLLAATHYANAHPARRRELHRLLADILEDEEQRAYHLARGAEAPDRAVAVRIELAAQAAARRGAPETGAELLEQAARLTPLEAAEVRRSRMISAAELHHDGGGATRARELLEEVLPQVPHGPARARTLFRLAQTRTDDHAVSTALMEEAVGEAGDHHRLRAQIEVMLADALSTRAEFAAALVHARAALESAQRANDPGILAVAIAAVEFDTLMTGGAVDLEAIRRGIQYDDSVELTWSRPSVALAQILFLSDDYAQARPALEQVVRLVRARGEVYETSFFVMNLALLDWYAGDPQAAEEHRITSAELDRDQGNHDHDVVHVYLEALFAAGRGELEAARALAVPALEMAERIGNPNFAVLPTTLLAYIDLCTGDPTAAHDRLRAMREPFLASGFGFIGSLTLELWSVDIEALIACGRLGEAELVLDDLLRRAGDVENPNAIAVAERCRGLLLGARGEIAPAIAAMQTALAEHARRPLRPQIARTLLELGALQRRAKQKSAAKQSLEQALTMFVAMGATVRETRTRDELGRIGLRRPAITEGLTPAQQRVAELVASGMTNREVANTLYMSVRSVESHLTKAYREFGVKSRAQLVAALTVTHPGADEQGYAGPSVAASSKQD